MSSSPGARERTSCIGLRDNPSNRCETALIRDGLFLHRLLASSAAARRAGAGESTVIAPSKAPSFKAGKTLRDAGRGWVPEPGENLALRKVTVANHPLPSVGQLLLNERRQVLLELRRDRRFDQLPRAGPKKLRQWVTNPC